MVGPRLEALFRRRKGRLKTFPVSIKQFRGSQRAFNSLRLSREQFYRKKRKEGVKVAVLLKTPFRRFKPPKRSTLHTWLGREDLPKRGRPSALDEEAQQDLARHMKDLTDNRRLPDTHEFEELFYEEVKKTVERRGHSTVGVSPPARKTVQTYMQDLHLKPVKGVEEVNQGRRDAIESLRGHLAWTVAMMSVSRSMNVLDGYTPAIRRSRILNFDASAHQWLNKSQSAKKLGHVMSTDSDVKPTIASKVETNNKVKYIPVTSAQGLVLIFYHRSQNSPLYTISPHSEVTSFTPSGMLGSV